MRKLKPDPFKKFVFMDKNNRRMIVYSGDAVSKEDVKRFEVPEHLLVPVEKKEKEKKVQDESGNFFGEMSRIRGNED